MKNFNAAYNPFAGSESTVSRLARSLADGTLPHAVLITGPDGCGRNFLARLTAQAYLGDESGLVQRAQHPDCILIAGSGTSGTITVDSVRAAVYEINRSAAMADGRRVVLVREAKNLNRSSAAALLKILEEPPAGILFILTAESIGDLIDTIVSRCAPFATRPLTLERCAELAQTHTPGADSAEVAALCRFYGGRPGLVLAALRDEQRRALVHDAVDWVGAILDSKSYRALVLANKYSEKPSSNIRNFITHCASALRERMQGAPENSARYAAILKALDDHLIKTEKNVNLKLIATSLVAACA